MAISIFSLNSLNLLSVFCICTVSFVFASQSNTKLVLFVFRHGDRSPYIPYKGYKHLSFWEQGPGQLTTVGMRQQHTLGLFIKQTYTPEIISSNYTRNQLYVRSTDVDRTIMSALSQLSGIFPPSGGQIFDSSIAWQPIPVHEVAKDRDNVLRGQSVYCPKYKKLVDEYKYTKEYIDMGKKYGDVLQTISDAQNTVVTLSNIESYIDTIFCDKQHNLSLPLWAIENYDTLLEIQNWYWRRYVDTREKVRLSGGRFLSDFWTKINDKINGNTPTIKAYFYSAHDSTLVSVTNGFSIWNQLQPPYATVLIAELIHEDTDWFMQFLYKNNSDSAPYPLYVPNCGYKCSVENLRQLTADVTVSQEEWENECEIETYSTENIKLIYTITILLCVFLISLVCIAIILTAMAIVFRRKYAPAPLQYSQFKIDDSAIGLIM
ncbi:Lysosomal acid phosphatase [Oopsacas minuta]|uniref:acid phosphatase n=1 Tax=Oopsacas minuta TaxID=111878 RepID=A0AAV7JZM9_9METZ|nr:Lysosomal acid phosphatase [Oopsacas minuta]